MAMRDSEQPLEGVVQVDYAYLGGELAGTGGRGSEDQDHPDGQRQPVHRRLHKQGRVPSGQHLFDLACRGSRIDHRLCPPQHPQTNGIERFNCRISDPVKQTRVLAEAELDDMLKHYLPTYNHLTPQRTLKH